MFQLEYFTLSTLPQEMWWWREGPAAPRSADLAPVSGARRPVESQTSFKLNRCVGIDPLSGTVARLLVPLPAPQQPRRHSKWLNQISEFCITVAAGPIRSEFHDDNAIASVHKSANQVFDFGLGFVGEQCALAI